MLPMGIVNVVYRNPPLILARRLFGLVVPSLLVIIVYILVGTVENKIF